LAQQICDELAVLSSPVTGVDMDLKAEASFRHARTLLAAKQFSEVSTYLNNFLFPLSDIYIGRYVNTYGHSLPTSQFSFSIYELDIN